MHVVSAMNLDSKNSWFGLFGAKQCIEKEVYPGSLPPSELGHHVDLKSTLVTPLRASRPSRMKAWI